MLLVAAGCASAEPDLDDLLEDAGADPDEPGLGVIDEQPEDPDDAGGDEAPEPEPAPEADDDPFAIPDEIDAAYVDLVMNELLAIDSEVLRAILSRDPGQGITDEDSLGIRAVASGPWLIKTSEDYLRYSNDADARTAFLSDDDLGRMRWSTEQIREADRSCIVAIGWYDVTEVSVDPYRADEYTAVSLVPLPGEPSDRRILDMNPTPWRIHDMNLLRTDGEPIPPEDWHRLDLGPTLESRCGETP